MTGLLKTVAASVLAISFSCAPVIAQEHHDHDQDHHDAYVRHEEWKKGSHMRHEDWQRAQHVDDWKTHHLRHPPSGYEWRDIDGQYVLANGDGVIYQVVVPR